MRYTPHAFSCAFLLGDQRSMFTSRPIEFISRLWVSYSKCFAIRFFLLFRHGLEPACLGMQRLFVAL